MHNCIPNFFQGGKKLTEKKFKKVAECVSQPELVAKMGPEFHQSLNHLWLWASDTLKDGRTLAFKLHEDAFGSGKKNVMFLSDVHALCFGGEISGSTICYFIK